MKNLNPNTRHQRKPITPEAKRLAYLLVVNTLLFIAVYFGSMGINQPIISMIVTIVYWVAFAVLLLAYILYNRGFNNKNIHPDSLPPIMTAEEKAEFISDRKRRYENSKWMLVVIVPLLITISLDAIYLFTWPMIQNLFNI